MQGFAAFKLNVQTAQEDREKLARAAGKFKNQRMGLAFETWKQHTQHKQLLQSCLSKAVAALVNRSLRAKFTAWRGAAALKKQHSHKVYNTCFTACSPTFDRLHTHRNSFHYVQKLLRDVNIFGFD